MADTHQRTWQKRWLMEYQSAVIRSAMVPADE
jgi:hypothetical protein